MLALVGFYPAGGIRYIATHFYADTLIESLDGLNRGLAYTVFRGVGH